MSTTTGIVLFVLFGLAVVGFVLWLFWDETHWGQPHEWERTDPRYRRCVRCGKLDWEPKRTDP